MKIVETLRRVGGLDGLIVILMPAMAIVALLSKVCPPLLVCLVVLGVIFLVLLTIYLLSGIVFFGWVAWMLFKEWTSRPKPEVA